MAEYEHLDGLPYIPAPPEEPVEVVIPYDRLQRGGEKFLGMLAAVAEKLNVSPLVLVQRRGGIFHNGSTALFDQLSAPGSVQVEQTVAAWYTPEYGLHVYAFAPSANEESAARMLEIAEAAYAKLERELTAGEVPAP